MSSYQRERVRLLSGRDHKYMGKYERVSAGTVSIGMGIGKLKVKPQFKCIS